MRVKTTNKLVGAFSLRVALLAAVVGLASNATTRVSHAAGLAPIPDDMEYTISEGQYYLVGRRENASGDDFIAAYKIQQAADDLDFMNDGLHWRYADDGFTAPWFSLFNVVAFYDCNKDKEPGEFGCDNGLARADAIYMPTPNYVDKPTECIRTVVGHELFHHIQFAYVGNIGHCSSRLGVGCEGMARMLQDKLYLDADNAKASGAQCTASYYNAVNAYLGNPFLSLWDESSYLSALWWNYLAEQFGENQSEPNYGLDFLVRWYEIVEADENYDPIAVTTEALALYGDGRSLGRVFQDFTIANYAKDTRLDLWPPETQAQWSYVDDVAPADYKEVLRFEGQVSQGAPWQVSLLGVTQLALKPWSSIYFEADVSECPPDSVIHYEVDASGSGWARYAFMTLREGQDPDPYVRLHQLWRDTGYGGAATSIVQTDPPFDLVTGIVTTTVEPSSFSARFSCSLSISGSLVFDPTPPDPDPPGPHPSLVIPVIVDPPTGPLPLSGIPPDQWEVEVGGLPATVLAVSDAGGRQVIQYLPPESLGEGSHEVVVRLGRVGVTAPDPLVLAASPARARVLALDQSGSLVTPNAVPQAHLELGASFFVDLASERGELGLVHFAGDGMEPNDDAVVSGTLASVDDTQRAALHAAIAALSPSPTALASLGDGLAAARAEIEGGSRSTGRHVVLVADGPESEASSWADERSALVAAGIRVHGVALGPAADQALLQAIALETGGSFHYVEAAQSGDGFALHGTARALAAVADTIEGRQRFFEAEGSVDLATSALHTIEVDEAGLEDAVIAVRWPGDSEPVGVTLRRPRGAEVVDGALGARVLVQGQHRAFHLPTLEAGSWELEVAGGTGPAEYLALASARNSGGALLTLQVGQSADAGDLVPGGRGFVAGVPVEIRALVVDAAGPIPRATVVAEVDTPQGALRPILLRDDGSQGDTIAGDGVFAGVVTATGRGSPTAFAEGAPGTHVRGSYRVEVSATGTDNQGAAFSRHARRDFQLVDNGSGAEDGDEDGLPSRWELRHPCLDPEAPDAGEDPDEDGLDNAAELDFGSLPCVADSDGGGEADASEQAAGLDPSDSSDDRLPAPLRFRHLKEPPPHESDEFFEAGVVILEYPQTRGIESIEVQRRLSGGSGGTGEGEEGTPPTRWRAVERFSPDVHGGRWHDPDAQVGETYEYRMIARMPGGAQSLSRPTVVTVLDDMVAPHAVLEINDGRPRTDSVAASLKITIDNEVDPGSSEMAVDDVPIFGEPSWVPFAAESPWTLQPDASGYAAVHAQLRDGSGNTSLPIAAGIEVWPPGSLADVHGTVVDDEGAPIVNAYIDLLGEGGEPGVQSAADGSFVLLDLLPGSYELIVEHPQYQGADIPAELAAGDVASVGEIVLVPEPAALVAALAALATLAGSRRRRPR